MINPLLLLALAILGWRLWRWFWREMEREGDDLLERVLRDLEEGGEDWTRG